MEGLVELGRLMDWYGDFLTPRQRSLVRQYVYEDCSLSEIAEREGISRQGVRDAIVKARREMREMEQKLSLLERLARQRALLEKLAGMTDDPALLAGLNELADIWEDDDGV